MTPQETARYFQAFAQWIEANREAVALEAANTVRELVRARVQERGLSPQGTPWAPYTPAYRARKGRQGYDVSKVDYTRTNSLWTDIQPRVTRSDAHGVTVLVGPEQPRNIAKLKGRGALSPRLDGVSRGLIHRPSDAEVADGYQLWVQSIISKFETP